MTKNALGNFEIDYNLVFFYPIATKLNCKYALICSNSAPISRQSIKACVSYNNFKKCCKKKKKNMKKIRWTLKAHILGTAWRIQLKFGIGGAPSRRNSHRKIRVFLFRECWATDVWKRRFLYSCKIHTCLSRSPGFLGRTTHHRVSWSDLNCSIMLECTR